MRLTSLLLFLVLILVSCNTELKPLKAPKNLIPQDSLTQILHEMILLEALSEDQFLNITERKAGVSRSGDSLLKAFHISEERFKTSFEYFASQQDMMQEIYTTIQDSMTFELNRLEVQK